MINNPRLRQIMLYVIAKRATWRLIAYNPNLAPCPAPEFCIRQFRFNPCRHVMKNQLYRARLADPCLRSTIPKSRLGRGGRADVYCTLGEQMGTSCTLLLIAVKKAEQVLMTVRWTILRVSTGRKIEVFTITIYEGLTPS